MKIYVISILILLSIDINCYSQQSGEYIYEFLNIGSSARVEAMGGKHIALLNSGSDFSFYNPSYLNKEHDNEISVNYTNYLTDINYGFVSYARDFGKKGSFLIGLHYLNYGKFQEADIYGNKGNSFGAADYALIISWAKALSENFSLGANIKPIYSSLEKYNSLGIALDIAINYKSKNNLFTASFATQNIGYQIKPYYGSHREKLPLELIAGISYKLEYAPIQGNLTFRNLEQINNITDNIIIGLELFPKKKINLRAGYNVRLNKELSLEDTTSMVGFSWGFGINLSKFKISYASKSYHIAGSSNIFSISTNINKLNFRN